MVDRDDDASLAAAAALEQTGRTGQTGQAAAWMGRAVTVKDWIDVTGMVCEGENAERTGRRPERDATVVARLRGAGAIVIAKTQPGAEHPIHGRCVHPLDEQRSPGGSSSGEAALIGAGASSLGLGSDSGGSIRLPAAWCGVFGFKPSNGLVPTTGHFPRVGGRHDGRTVIGPLARSSVDLFETIRLIAGPDGVDPDCIPVPVGDPASVSFDGLRVAVVDGGAAWRPARSTADAVQRAAAALEAVGASVLDAPAPVDLDESLDITSRYWNRWSLSGSDADRQLRGLGPLQRPVHPRIVRVRRGARADRRRRRAPLVRPVTGTDYVFTLPWSLTGWPAVSIPAGTDEETGMPLAVQVAAPRWEDHVVLAVASLLERQLVP